MKTKLVLAGVFVLSCIALAYADGVIYSEINSNGGFPLSSENSHKKAGLRGWVMQYVGTFGSSCQFDCPDGTQCQGRGSCPGAHVTVENCLLDGGLNPSHVRTCTLKASGVYVADMSYCQGGTNCGVATFYVHGRPWGWVRFSDHTLNQL